MGILEAVTSLENTRRGVRATATHCSNGHPLTFLRSGRQRRCRVCLNAYAREYQRRHGKKHYDAYRARKRAKEMGKSA